MPYVFCLIFHFLICLILLICILTGVLKVHKYMFFVALFLPFWGPLLLLILHFQIFFRADDGKEIDVEKLKLESELYKSITVDDKKVADSTVPIEEALIVNSAQERRSIIMDVLNDNPKEYVEFLQKAGNNDDTEVVHYAVTAMVEISKENDFMLQRFEQQYAANPDDLSVLTQYTDFLWSCLSQNLMQGQVETLNRELFAMLIEKKLRAGGSVADYSRMITNELKRKNYSAAGKGLQEMERHYATNEEYLLLRLHYLAALGRGADIQQFIRDIENKHMYLSGKTKEELAFWDT